MGCEASLERGRNVEVRRDQDALRACMSFVKVPNHSAQQHETDADMVCC